MTVATFMG